jgi:hypothetical protein
VAAVNATPKIARPGQNLSAVIRILWIRYAVTSGGRGVLMNNDGMNPDDVDISELLKNHPMYQGKPDALKEVVSNYLKDAPPRPIPPALPSLDELVDKQKIEIPPPVQKKIDRYSQIPDYMQRQRRWSVFKRRWNEARKKFDKTPCTPTGGIPYPGYPNIENRNDFADFTDVKKLCDLDTTFFPAYYLLKKDRILFLDFDPPCDVPDYPTYTERSISGGYHCFGWYDGAIPKIPDTKEVYCDRRWVVVTGDIVGDKCDITDITDTVIELNRENGTTVPSAYNRFRFEGDIPSGERNITLFRFASSMRAAGATKETIAAALATENKTRCHPPLPDSELMAIVNSAGKYPQGEPPKRPAPEGDITRDRIYAGASSGEFTKVQQSLDALIHVYNNPSPRIFVRSGKLCRIVYSENFVPSIQPLDENSLSVILTQCIDWFNYQEIVNEKIGKDGKVELGNDGKPIKIKTRIEALTTTPQLLVSRLYALGQWEGIPALGGIVESPYITNEGVIITAPGYNPKTRLYLAQSQNFKGINVPDSPTREQVMAAKKRLFELFSEFTFEDEASRENHISCIITTVIRPIIEGAVPLYVYDKPVMGAGASLLAELINGINTGRPASLMQAPEKNTQGEWNKLIIGLLREGRSLNIFDNVEGDMYSSALASALTGIVYSGRVLGKNRMEEYPNKSVWIANGNNIQITHDLPRRCVWCRLATNTSRPYERTDWKIKNIREYTIEHQCDYLSDVLTIVRGWFVAHKPGLDKDVPVMGSYEKWQEIVGGIMKFMECKNFLGNTSTNLDIAEEAHEDVEVFLEEVFYAFTEKDTKVTDAVQKTRFFQVKDIEPIDDNINYLKGRGGVRTEKMPSDMRELQREHPLKVPQAMGDLFKKHIGRVFPMGYKVLRGKKSNNTATYRIEFSRPVK